MNEYNPYGEKTADAITEEAVSDDVQNREIIACALKILSKYREAFEELAK